MKCTFTKLPNNLVFRDFHICSGSHILNRQVPHGSHFVDSHITSSQNFTFAHKSREVASP